MCNTGLKKKKLVLKGDKVFIEFLSDDDINRSGFSFDYFGKSSEITTPGGTTCKSIGCV